MLSFWILGKPLFISHQNLLPASSASAVTLLAKKTHTHKDKLSVSHLPHADPLSSQLLTYLGVSAFLPTFKCLFLVLGCYRPDVKTGQNNHIASYMRTGKWGRGRRDSGQATE